MAASFGRGIVLGDAKNAFCQSDKSQRPGGWLYAWLCHGVPEEAGSLIRLDAEVYGLIRAPAHWRKTLTRKLTELGYQKS
eukprot:12517646-Alexandrium_andersonii.AAC.1